MPKVTGIGGVFFLCGDSAATRDWYRDHLGLESTDFGRPFLWREHEHPQQVGYTIWSPMKQGAKHFAPSKREFMVNYRVEGIDEMVRVLKTAGVEMLSEVESYPNGKFAWLLDPEGVKVELWEPVPSESDPMLK